MSCGISEKAKELTDKLDEIDQKIEDTLNEIPGIAEAQKFADDLEGELNSLKDKVMGNIPILGGGSLPPELQSLQADVEKAIGFVMQGVNGVNEVKGQMEYIKGKWGDVDLGDIKSIDDLSNMITSGAADLDNLCSAVTNAIPDPNNPAKIKIEATPISIPDIDVLGVLLGDPLPKLNPPKLELIIEGPQTAASNTFNDVTVNRFDP